jgi:hypothetical protein
LVLNSGHVALLTVRCGWLPTSRTAS